MLSAEVEGWMDNIIQNIGFIPKPEEEHMLFVHNLENPVDIARAALFTFFSSFSDIYSDIRPRLRLKTKQSKVTVTHIYIVSFYFLRKKT